MRNDEGTSIKCILYGFAALLLGMVVLMDGGVRYFGVFQPERTPGILLCPLGVVLLIVGCRRVWSGNDDEVGSRRDSGRGAQELLSFWPAPAQKGPAENRKPFWGGATSIRLVRILQHVPGLVFRASGRGPQVRPPAWISCKRIGDGNWRIWRAAFAGGYARLFLLTGP